MIEATLLYVALQGNERNRIFLAACGTKPHGLHQSAKGQMDETQGPWEHRVLRHQHLHRYEIAQSIISHTDGCKRPYKHPTQAHTMYTEFNANTSFGSQGWPPIFCDIICLTLKKKQTNKNIWSQIHPHVPTPNSILHQNEEICHL